jgi:hypothetical protein
MKPFEVKLDRELRAGAQYLAQCLTPEAGAIPRIPNVDIHGVTIPLNGIVGGDLITLALPAHWPKGRRILRRNCRN